MNIVMILAALVLLSAFVIVCAKLMNWKRTNVRLMANANNQPGAGRAINGVKTYLSDAAIATRYFLVKSGSDEKHAAASAADTDKILGICLDECAAAEEPINVAVLGACYGTQLVVAGEAILVDAYVVSAGNGKVKSTVSSKYAIGKALMAAAGDGDVIEIAPMLADRVMA